MSPRPYTIPVHPGTQPFLPPPTQDSVLRGSHLIIVQYICQGEICIEIGYPRPAMICLCQLESFLNFISVPNSLYSHICNTSVSTIGDFGTEESIDKPCREVGVT